MARDIPYRFAFTRTLCPHLSEAVLQEADARLTAYLNLVSTIAVRGAHEEAGDSRFDKTGQAPQDSTLKRV